MNELKEPTRLIIKINRLVPHPLQEKIYGLGVDDNLVSSIRDNGVRTPIVIADCEDYFGGRDFDDQYQTENGEQEYIIVSGHSRVSACEANGINEIPADLYKYTSPEQMDADHLIMNCQREKTDTQKMNEFIAYKQIMCQVAKWHAEHRSCRDGDPRKAGLCTNVQSMGIDPDKPFNQRKDAIERLGLSGRREYDDYNTVFSDENFCKRINKIAPYVTKRAEFEDDAREMIEGVRVDVLSLDLSLTDAVKLVKNEFAKAEKSFLPKPAKVAKTEKIEKPKMEKLKVKMVRFEDADFSGPEAKGDDIWFGMNGVDLTVVSQTNSVGIRLGQGDKEVFLSEDKLVSILNQLV